MGQFAVIGLGRFGAATSLELMRLGHSVLGVDIDGRVVDQHAERLTRAAIADVTDRDALAELGLEEYDVVLVAIGEDIQASLVCTVHLKSMGVRTLWVKASSRAHHLILTKLGVSRIIHPEEEMGIRIAQVLSYPMVNDYIALGNGDFVVEIEASDVLEAQGVHVDTLRVRAFPFPESVRRFIEEHDVVYVIEQNRDAQLRSMLVNELEASPAQLVPVLHFDGTPITARFIVREIADRVKGSNVEPLKRGKVA